MTYHIKIRSFIAQTKLLSSKNFLLILSTSIGFIWSSLASAKLLNINIEELIDRSHHIIYVQKLQLSASTADKNIIPSNSAVRYKILSVLKGVIKENDVFICNHIGEEDSYDLNKIEPELIVFANKKGNCYEPIWGIRSVVRVSNGIALTVGISAQPEKQDVQQFLQNIKKSITRKPE